MKQTTVQKQITDESQIYIVTENGDGLHHFSFEKVDFLFLEKPQTDKPIKSMSLGELKKAKINKGDSMFYVNGYGWIRA